MVEKAKQINSLLTKNYKVLNKGIRWMPWHGEPMKDVESRDSLRRAAHRRYYP